MAAPDSSIDGREDAEATLDTVFDALAHPYRRRVIEELERDAPLDYVALAQRVAAGEDATTKRIRVELAHRHLPRLDEAGVVEYHPDSGQCDLGDAETGRSILDAVDDVV